MKQQKIMIRNLSTFVTTVILLLLSTTHIMKAQVTLGEVNSGMNKTGFSLFTVQPIDAQNKFSFEGMSAFYNFQKSEQKIYDEVLTEGSVFYKPGKVPGIGLTLYYNSVTGFQQKLSMLSLKNSPNWTLLFIPDVAHLSLLDEFDGELYAQVAYHPHLDENWNLYIGGKFLSAWSRFKTHSRSFAQFRLGMGYKGIEFGLSSDLDYYGPKPESIANFGIFIRKVFLPAR